MLSRTVLVVAALTVLPLSAVAAPATNGKFVNTGALNGKFVNGKFVNSTDANGRYLNTADVGNDATGWPTAWKDGFYFWDAHIEGTGLATWVWDWSTSQWTWRTGEFFEGTRLQGRLTDAAGRFPETVPMVIKDIVQPPGASMLLHYVEFESRDPYGNVSWLPLCDKDAYGAPVPAIMLQGEWSQAEYTTAGGDQINDSPYRVTFACATGALGKCAADCSDDAACALHGVNVALGYKRWAGTQLETAGGYNFYVRDYVLDHQACTRMVRADYCGDGHSWTENGTMIDVYDKTFLNVRSESPNLFWDYEATWNEDGAVRIACARKGQSTITCPPPPDVAFPWDYTTAVSYSCFNGDGLGEPEARMGNLRWKALDIGGWRPIGF